MIFPELLRQGDKIAILAPARKVSKEEMAPAIQAIHEAGFIAVESPYLYGSNHQFSGSDIERLSDLQWAFSQDQIKAIWCARGGYGMTRIIDQISASLYLKKPKWVIGFSDITLLINSLANTGFCSLHGPMALHASDKNFKEDIQSVFALLQGKYESIQWQTTLRHSQSVVEGKLLGGNLSMLAHSVGSPFFPKPDGDILFLEDIDEYLYHIDRMFRQLARTGIFNKIKALVLGSFTDMKDHKIPFGEGVLEIALTMSNTYGFVLLDGFPAGHGAKNQPIVMGSEVKIRLNGHDATLKYDQMK
jgi:muramoyltetrapeptide carboxypeptidase